MRCRGDVVQIDTQFTIRSTELGALRRFSFDEITSENCFSQSGVRYPERLKSGDVLLFEGADYCLRVGSFKSYESKAAFYFFGTPIIKYYIRTIIPRRGCKDGCKTS